MRKFKILFITLVAVFAFGFVNEINAQVTEETIAKAVPVIVSEAEALEYANAIDEIVKVNIINADGSINKTIELPLNKTGLEFVSASDYTFTVKNEVTNAEYLSIIKKQTGIDYLDVSLNSEIGVRDLVYVTNPDYNGYIGVNDININVVAYDAQPIKPSASYVLDTINNGFTNVNGINIDPQVEVDGTSYLLKDLGLSEADIEYYYSYIYDEATLTFYYSIALNNHIILEKINAIEGTNYRTTETYSISGNIMYTLVGNTFTPIFAFDTVITHYDQDLVDQLNIDAAMAALTLGSTKEEKLYTVDSWEKFATAYAIVYDLVKANGPQSRAINPSQAPLNLAVADLNDAMANLVLVDPSVVDQNTNNVITKTGNDMLLKAILVNVVGLSIFGCVILYKKRKKV